MGGAAKPLVARETDVGGQRATREAEVGWQARPGFGFAKKT
jgi:hypothetical protein